MGDPTNFHRQRIVIKLKKNVITIDSMTNGVSRATVKGVLRRNFFFQFHVQCLCILIYSLPWLNPCNCFHVLRHNSVLYGCFIYGSL